MKCILKNNQNITKALDTLENRVRQMEFKNEVTNLIS